MTRNNGEMETTIMSRDDESASSSGTSQTFSALMRKLILLPPMVFALYMIEVPSLDDGSATANATVISTFDNQGTHYPAFLWALQAHPPSRRVFRALFEFTLLLYCTAMCLRVWERVFDTREKNCIGRPCFNEQVGTNMVGHLLFQPVVRNSGGGGDDDDDGPVNNSMVEEELHMSSSDRGRYSDTPVEEDDNEEEEEDGDEGVELVSYAGKLQEPLAPFEEQVKEAANEESDSPPLPSFPVYHPPSSMATVNAAMDMTLLIVFCLTLFTLGSVHLRLPKEVDQAGGAVAVGFVDMINQGLLAAMSPAFPLVLFAVAMFRTVFPWSQRKGFWTVLSITMEAPFQNVTFRDGFVGDILTSTVRPLQDLAFTTFYIMSGLRGWWSSMYSLDEAAAPVEHSWLLHTCILPACMISPLWWRFLQNLRQAYHEKQRWPYLGNALKYMIAAEVALFGVFDPSNKQTFVWLTSFTVATLYQVWWDVVMDWELLEISHSSSCEDEEDTTRSKYGGYGYDDATRRRSTWFGALRQWIPNVRLRKKRLYPTNAYYAILVINVLLRFCWTLSFIPPNYLSRSGEIAQQFSVGIQQFFSPLIASAEIIRRSLWGLIRLELEAFKVKGRIDAEKESVVGSKASQELHARSAPALATKPSESDIETDAAYDMSLDDMQPMNIGLGRRNFGNSASRTKQPWLSLVFQSDMSHMSDIQILMELCLWATAFTSLGIFAAAHREVL